MEQWAYHPWFGIILTVGIWVVARWLRHRAGTPLLDPVMLTIAAIIGVLLLADIPFEAYNRGGRVLDFLLGPSVVALAVPFYRRLEKIKRNLVPILISVAVGSITGIVSAVGLALLLGGSSEIADLAFAQIGHDAHRHRHLAEDRRPAFDQRRGGDLHRHPGRHARSGVDSAHRRPQPVRHGPGDWAPRPTASAPPAPCGKASWKAP